MGSTQKYSLKWNDFTVNVASTFRDLHSRHDFVDVTLACADGSQLEAHKVILSSVSSYFRDILKVRKIFNFENRENANDEMKSWYELMLLSNLFGYFELLMTMVLFCWIVTT